MKSDKTKPIDNFELDYQKIYLKKNFANNSFNILHHVIDLNYKIVLTIVIIFAITLLYHYQLENLFSHDKICC